MSKFGKELIESAREALDIASGRKPAARRYDFENTDVAAIRKRLGMSQSVFAARYGLSVATVRDWEQGRRMPDRTARTLLSVISAKPKLVAEVVRNMDAAE